MRDAEFVDLKMRRGTLLVIFEYLARNHDEWRKTGKAPDDYSESTFVLSRPDPAKESLYGGSKEKLKELYQISLTRSTKN
jgi:hypothetical protein